ncbi:replicative DNA helicase [Paenibacillus sp. JDR-2]|uniref:replicative DNA helicase n=1 Tax=Paenibacillus sp. (strain JDR-2) TaxID=324057 RepID=UPI000166A376|nr:replicative DNA helicase [Paenibacillus sp. JDR-2]ACT00262.1 replicative DNA helicase [Paenibacillus sp. JDR-2]
MMQQKNDVLGILGIEEPRDIEAEQAVIGAIILNPDALEQAKERLGVGEWHDQSHARIYRGMMKLYDDGTPVDIRTLTAYLQDSDELSQIGGVSYLSRLVSAVPTAANTEYYIKRVKDMYLRREAIYGSLDLLKQAAEATDLKGFTAMAEAIGTKLTDEATPAREFVTMKSALMEVWEDAEKNYANRENNRGITGLSSGFEDLDKMTAGFQKSDLIIIAARPSVGKTAFALNIAQNIGVRLKETVAIFSLEMSAKQLVQRMISSEGNIEGEKLKTGYFEGDDWEKMSFAVAELAKANIFIDDTPGITVREIRAKCRKLKKEKGLGLILIDYLQLIQGRGGDNRQQEVSDISRTLKEIARELEVPVIALSQLSRKVEERKDKRPMMSDLRESGSIEQDADIVGFLYRDDYYDKESEKKNIIEIILAKQRNGPVGTVELAMLKKYGKLLNLERA